MRAWCGGYRFDEHAFVQVFDTRLVPKFLAYPEEGSEKYRYRTGGSPLELRQYLDGDLLVNPERYGVDHRAYDVDHDSYKGLGDFDDLAMLALTGYLTFRKNDSGHAVLDYPNLEVATAMALMYVERHISRDLPDAFVDLFPKFDENAFLLGLDVFVADLDQALFPLRHERSLQSLLSLCIMSAKCSGALEVDGFNGACIPKLRADGRRFTIAVKYAGDEKDEEALLADAVDAFSEIRNDEYNGDTCPRIGPVPVLSGQDRAFTWYQVIRCGSECR